MRHLLWAALGSALTGAALLFFPYIRAADPVPATPSTQTVQPAPAAEADRGKRKIELFSRDDVAAFVNERFEPVWISVRPVPIVRIDFGNGRVLTRTLHGNILTSVCNADGYLLDALPGIYEPAEYLHQLDQLALL